MRQEKDDTVRLAMVVGVFEACGREFTDLGLRMWAAVLEPVPTAVLGAAVVTALGQSKGFMPLPGDVLEAARLAGRWQDLRRSAIRDPYWYRQIGQAMSIQPVDEEPHHPQRLTANGNVGAVTINRPDMRAGVSEENNGPAG